MAMTTDIAAQPRYWSRAEGEATNEYSSVTAGVAGGERESSTDGALTGYRGPVKVWNA